MPLAANRTSPPPSPAGRHADGEVDTTATRHERLDVRLAGPPDAGEAGDDGVHQRAGPQT